MKNTQGRKTPRNKGSRQSAKEKAAKRKCPSCCFKCLPIISGLILFILIAGSITLIRGVLEVPVIINGFAPNRRLSTVATTILSSTSQTLNFSTSASNDTSATNTSDSNNYSPNARCYFVGEMEVKENISIELNSDPSSEEYLRITEGVEKMINGTYKTSAFNTVYITTKVIGISPVYSAIRFWMHLECSVRFRTEEITAVFQKAEGTINFPNNQQLKVQLNTMIIWCENSMPRCSSGYCINKNNGFCDGIEDCWNGEDEAVCEGHSTTLNTHQQCTAGMMVCADDNCLNKDSGFCDGDSDCSDGSDEWNCDCEISRATDCSSVVTLTGRKYRNPCQGSLISNKWVLTTESCAEDSSFQYICAGSPKLTKYRIESRYTLDSTGEGIALLLLDSPVAFNGFQPIPLPSPMNQTETAQTSCKVTGLWNTTRQGEWYVIASDEQRIVVHEVFQHLRNCQVQRGSPLVCLEANETWVLTAVRGGCSRLQNNYRRINDVLSKIKEKIDPPPAVDNDK
ncbi:transmembrane protease serine 6-like [Mobula hypostoma]|uniref:transmembrane protease serine 6-like n=1 Tax=Mobula hypostoma TaxID=723540 RepID=UPI002FC2A947